jgi:hypothetical protein
MRFHPRILTSRQQATLSTLGPIADELGFYLGGGTAIALCLGHRMSDDFDWFTERAFVPLDLAAELDERGVRFRRGFEAPHTLAGSVHGIKTSFIRFRHRRVAETTRWNRFGIELASLEDLATMKLSAIVQRGSRRDFIDLHALGTSGPALRLERMLELYRRRFKTADVAHVLYGLAYFADADAERMPRMLREVSWDTVKKTITRWVVDLG